MVGFSRSETKVKEEKHNVNGAILIPTTVTWSKGKDPWSKEKNDQDWWREANRSEGQAVKSKRRFPHTFIVNTYRYLYHVSVLQKKPCMTIKWCLHRPTIVGDIRTLLNWLSDQQDVFNP